MRRSLHPVENEETSPLADSTWAKSLSVFGPWLWLCGKNEHSSSPTDRARLLECKSPGIPLWLFVGG